MKYICLGLFIICFYSCDDYLEPKLTNQYGNDITWGLPDYAMGTLFEAYSSIMGTANGYNGNNFLDAVTDNSLTTHAGSSLFDYVFGSQSPHGDPLGNWGTCYENIAIVNLFLEKGLSEDIIYDLVNPEYDRIERDRLKGEAYFLRAWFQHELLRNYGGHGPDGQALGYVIVTRVFTEDELSYALSLSRNSIEECVEQILSDLETAIEYLPLQYHRNARPVPPVGVDELQRASGKAAWALKSRVALMGASPAYQPKGEHALSEEDLRKKWLRAAKISNQAIEAILTDRMMPAARMIPLNNDLLVGSIVNLNTGHDRTYDEILFSRRANNAAPETHHFPAMWHGLAKCNPSQNLVNAYPMSNGYPITHPNSGYNSQNPYANRDGRFALQINYNGGKFNNVDGERTLEIYASAADGSIGRDAPGFDYRNTWTGYYIRKGMSFENTNLVHDPNNPNSTPMSVERRNPLLRRAEVWLNLAEAINELSGPTALVADLPEITETAVDIVKALRNANGTRSSGTPANPVDAYADEVAAQGKEEFTSFILNERRIEFAFENMRLWDLRRRLLPLNETILGVRIFKDANNNFIYFGTNPGVDNIEVQTRRLDDEKFYSSPIPYAEIVKNSNLIQNAGW